MSIWLIAQIFFNIVTTLVIFILWAKLKRPPQEDPRMSRGLQLLQSKIAIMENLSDKTEEQFKNINELIEKKTQKLQKFIIKSEEQIGRLDSSMQKSNEIANIFQDKIPHQEIIERKQSMQMITAARMAHQGASVEEIVDKVKLPKAQVELITKINKDQLIFDNQTLPAWVKKMESKKKTKTSPAPVNEVLELTNSFDIQNSGGDSWVQEPAQQVFANETLIDKAQINRIEQMGADFKALCTNYEQNQRQLDHEIENNLTQRMFNGAEKASHVVAKNLGDASHVLAQNMGEVSQSVAASVGKNMNQVSHRVAHVANDVGQKVMGHVGEVGKVVVDSASVVGEKIIERTGQVLDSKNKFDEEPKTKIKKIKFPIIDSDKDLF